MGIEERLKIIDYFLNDLGQFKCVKPRHVGGTDGCIARLHLVE